MAHRMGALVMILSCLFLTGCQQDAFKFQIAFAEAPYIKEGARLRYLGLDVGKVERVTINSVTGSDRPQVIVSAVVSDKNVHIRQGDKFSVATAGLLGDAFVDIRPGPASAPAIAPGAILQGEASPGSLRTLEDFLTGMGINAGLQSLSKEKREALIKSFNGMISTALEEKRAKLKIAREPPEPKH